MVSSPKVQVLFENDHLIAVDKPAGQTVIPGRNLGEGIPPLVEAVSKKIGKKAYVVHRLDRETSGLVLFAKDAPAHREICLQWENREVLKIYRALVLGIPPQTEGRIEFFLKAFGSGRMGVDPKGKASLTRYRVLQTFSRSSLLEVKPETGRRHQIRVHLYHLGFPVMGDPLYGKERPVGGSPRLMLHAAQVSLNFQGRDLTLVCKPGDDFEEVLKKEAELGGNGPVMM
jgi:tRNA pseudouridine32 synthase / 23S rRNA pseudouridine746 synthase